MAQSQNPVRLSPPPRPGPGEPPIVAEYPVVVVGAGPVGLSLAIDLAQRGQIGGAARRRRPDRRGLARDLLFKTLAGILGPARHRPAHGRQGRGVERRQDLSRRFPALSVQPAARGGPQAARLHQPAAVLRRGLSGRPRRGACRGRPALAQQGDGAGAAQRLRRADGRDAGWALPAARAICRRLRRRALVAAADGRRGVFRPGVRGPVSDRRRQDDRGVPDRTLVLVRSAVSCRALGAAAQAARRHLAHRPAAQSGCRRHRRRRSRKMCGRGSRACSATTSSISNGSRSTSSSAGAWTASSMAG